MSARRAEELSASAALPGSGRVLLVVALTALLCAWAPLQVYMLSLAAFGLAHALAELRYLDARFGPRLRGPTTRWSLAAWLGALLLLAAGARLLWLGGALPGAARARVELVLLLLLGAAALPALLRRGAWAALLGGGLLLGLLAGLIGDPALALLGLAWAHNLTPVAFLAERLRGSARRRALGLAAVAFGVVPVALLLGLPAALGLASLAPDRGPLVLGSWEDGLAAWLPLSAWGRPWAHHALAAAACLQCLHYAAVLHVLPRLADPDRREAASSQAEALLPWPARGPFALLLALAGGALLLWFLRDFGRARAAYGVVAIVHAWVELPLLLLALGAAPRAPATSPLTSTSGAAPSASTPSALIGATS